MINTLLSLDESRAKYNILDYELRKKVGHEVEGIFVLLLNNMAKILYTDEYNQLYKHLVQEKLRLSLGESLDFAEEKMKYVRYTKNGKQVVCAIKYIDSVYNHCIDNSATLHKDEALTSKANYFLSNTYKEVSKKVFDERTKDVKQSGKYHYIFTGDDELAKDDIL